MSATKKDYEAVAAAMRRQLGIVAGLPEGNRQSAVNALADVAVRIADHFSQSSMSFDRPRFLKACGVLDMPHEMSDAQKSKMFRSRASMPPADNAPAIATNGRMDRFPVGTIGRVTTFKASQKFPARCANCGNHDDAHLNGECPA